nr:NAD(P)-dependent oxidoreductase [Chitinophaga sedimenti]
MLINTSRGGLVCTQDVIDALKSGIVGYLGIDVYEQEEKLFFRDLSEDIIQDDQIQRLMSFPNVLVTAHQAFLRTKRWSRSRIRPCRILKELRAASP